MKRTRFALACAALFASSAFAGMYDQPYAIIEPADRSATREEFPPAITKIDGVSTRNPRRSDPISPGKHKVTVRFETARVAQSPGETSRELDMELEGCKLYRIAARRKGSIDWEPVVYTEPLPECVKKFKGKSG